MGHYCLMTHSCPTCGQPTPTVSRLNDHRIEMLSSGAYAIDGERWESDLTRSERRLVEIMLAQHIGGRESVSVDVLFGDLYQDVASRPVSTKIIHVMVNRIRRKLSETPLKIGNTVDGYCLRVSETPVLLTKSVIRLL